MTSRRSERRRRARTVRSRRGACAPVGVGRRHPPVEHHRPRARAAPRPCARRSRRAVERRGVRRQTVGRRTGRFARRRWPGLHPPGRAVGVGARRTVGAVVVPVGGAHGVGDGRTGALAARRLDRPAAGERSGTDRWYRPGSSDSRRGTRRRGQPTRSVGRPDRSRPASGTGDRPIVHPHIAGCGDRAGVARWTSPGRPLRVGAGHDGRSRSAGRVGVGVGPGVGHRPWPGALPSPSPATVFADPHPVEVLDEHGEVVRVTGRGMVSASSGDVAAVDGRRGDRGGVVAGHGRSSRGRVRGRSRSAGGNRNVIDAWPGSRWSPTTTTAIWSSPNTDAGGSAPATTERAGCQRSSVSLSRRRRGRTAWEISN